MALYNSTGGANWTTRTNWGSLQPLTTWFGVTTNTDDRVITLYLTTAICEGNNLVGTLPAALGNLDQLAHLFLCGNRLSGTIPDLSNLSYLLQLRLDGNQLSGEIPDSLGNLTNLTHLDLNRNALSGSIPDSLGSLASLQNLSLWSNALSGSIPASLGSLTSLQYLYLGGNALSGSIPDSLGSLAQPAEPVAVEQRVERVDPGLAGRPHLACRTWTSAETTWTGRFQT